MKLNALLVAIFAGLLGLTAYLNDELIAMTNQITR
jgi:hypothetical protein